MAVKVKKSEDSKKVNLPAASIKVDRAKSFDKAIMFDMTVVECIKIYGCTYRTYTDKNTGEEKGIVGFPQKQGKDGKWYNHVYFFVTEEALAEIEKQIEALI